MRAFLLAAAFALAVPQGARAQPVSEASGPDTYLLFHLGALVPQGDLSSLPTGTTFGGLFGARFNQVLSFEAGVALDHARSDGAVRTRLLDIPISVSVAARLWMKQGELAVYAGPDLHMATLSVDTDSGLGESTRTDTFFGGHVGVRAGLNVWPTTLVGLDVRTSFAQARFGGSTRVDDTRIALTLGYRF